MNGKLWALAAAVFLAACDGGTSPRYGVGTGGGDGGTPGGTGKDTSSHGGGTDTSTVATLDSSRLDGPISPVVGGQVRKIAFYYPSDRKLHFVASSDGMVAGTYDRETVWDVVVTSTDTLSARFLNDAEPGFRDTVWLDTSTYRTVRLRAYTVAGSMEGMVTAPAGAVLSVSVQVHSEIIPNPATSTRFPAPLSAAAAGALVHFGASDTVLGTTKFLAWLPQR